MSLVVTGLNQCVRASEDDGMPERLAQMQAKVLDRRAFSLSCHSVSENEYECACRHAEVDNRWMTFIISEALAPWSCKILMQAWWPVIKCHWSKLLCSNLQISWCESFAWNRQGARGTDSVTRVWYIYTNQHTAETKMGSLMQVSKNLCPESHI